jgi:hypothetical protein
MKAKLLAAISVFCVGALPVLEGVLYVDDNAPNDPGLGDPLISDPAEDGSAEHPFDAVQQAINAAAHGDEVIIIKYIP